MLFEMYRAFVTTVNASKTVNSRHLVMDGWYTVFRAKLAKSWHKKKMFKVQESEIQLINEAYDKYKYSKKTKSVNYQNDNAC